MSTENLAGFASQVVPFASEVDVEYLYAIAGSAAAGLLVLWFYCWRRYNFQKATKALRCFETACVGRAHVVESRWTGQCQLYARLGFAPHWFENARVTIQMLPRPIPVQWFLSVLRKQRETLTFEADLGYAPGLHLDLFHQRWFTHRHIHTTAVAQNWSVTRPSPVVLTTRASWTHELTPVVNTLMTSRGHNLLSVRFRQSSPHLAATIDLEALSDEEMAAGFLGVLRDLAASASATKH